MQAFRQIVNVKDQLLHVVLPIDFKADKVEIIVLPIEKRNKPHQLKNSERFSGAISKETAEKFHKHLNEVRNEWERDIC
jgi:molecular chaperone DnaK (HSP70)